MTGIDTSKDKIEIMILNLNKSECYQILSKNYIGNLSYVFLNRPFVVPITYYFDEINNRILGYSGSGHKVKALRINNSASLGISKVESVNNWRSVQVQGTYREFEGSAAKINLHKFTEGVKELIKVKEGKDLHFLSEFSSKIYKEGMPIMFMLDIDEITGKARQYS
jgi:nitroimidazol reductase NimA-like FMN-containing flavoprotein (pyridoxamine 5'-phosphate oxidase superfamily)